MARKLLIGIILVLIVCTWGGIGYFAVKVINADPQAVGKFVGEFIKGVDDGRSK